MTFTLELTGKELAILAMVLNRCRGWDEPLSLERFASTAAEFVLHPNRFTEHDMDALADKLASVYRP